MSLLEDCAAIRFRLDLSDLAIPDHSTHPESVSTYLANANCDSRQELDSVWENIRAVLNAPPTASALDSAISGRAILFAGAGLSLDDTASDDEQRRMAGIGLRETLLAKIEQEVGAASESFADLPLPQIAQAYERIFKASELFRVLDHWCMNSLESKPLPQHTRLAQLNAFRFIVTTNWDRRIERAFEECYADTDTKLNVIRTSDDLSRFDPRQVTIIKLHGDFNHRSDDAPPTAHWDAQYRLTDREIRSLQSDEPALYDFVRGLCLAYEPIVVGLHPSDYNLYSFLLAYSQLSPETRVPYIVDPVIQQVHSLPMDMAHVKLPARTFFESCIAWMDSNRGSVGIIVGSKERPLHPVYSQSRCGQTREVAEQLSEAYSHLSRVEVCLTAMEQSAITPVMRAVGRRAAVLLREHVHHGAKVLSFGGGRTIATVVKEFAAQFRSGHIRPENLKMQSAQLLLHDAVLPYAALNNLQHLKTAFDADVFAFQIAALPKSLRSSILDQVFADRAAWPPPEAQIDQLDEWVREWQDSFESDVYCLNASTFPRKGTSIKDLPAFAQYAMSCLRDVRMRARPWSAEKDTKWTPSEHAEIPNAYYEALRSKHFVGEMSGALLRSIDSDNVYIPTVREAVHCLSEGAPPSNRCIFRRWVLLLATTAAVPPLNSLRDATQHEGKSVMLVSTKEEEPTALKALLDAGIGSTLIVDIASARRLLSKSRSEQEGG